MDQRFHFHKALIDLLKSAAAAAAKSHRVLELAGSAEVAAAGVETAAVVGVLAAAAAGTAIDFGTALRKTLNWHWVLTQQPAKRRLTTRPRWGGLLGCLTGGLVSGWVGVWAGRWVGTPVASFAEAALRLE